MGDLHCWVYVGIFILMGAGLWASWMIRRVWHLREWPRLYSAHKGTALAGETIQTRDVYFAVGGPWRARISGDLETQFLHADLRDLQRDVKHLRHIDVGAPAQPEGIPYQGCRHQDRDPEFAWRSSSSLRPLRYRASSVIPSRQARFFAPSNSLASRLTNAINSSARSGSSSMKPCARGFLKPATAPLKSM
jgi:hypothetical protein